MDDNFMTQVIKESMKEGTLLDLTLKQGRTGRVHEGWGSHGCSDNAGEVQEPEREQGKSRITTLDFRRTNFGLFSNLL